MIGPEFAPTWAIGDRGRSLAIVGWAILHPVLLLRRAVRRSVAADRSGCATSAMHIIDRVAEPASVDPVDAQERGRRRASTRSARSSSSRSTATTATSRAEGAWAIKQLLDHYDTHKSRMPTEWFDVDRADFVGLSDEALEMLTEAQDLVRDEVPAADRARLPARAARARPTRCRRISDATA